MESTFWIDGEIPALQQGAPIRFAHHRGPDKADNHRLHINNHMEIYFFISGNHQYIVENDLYALKPGDAILIDDGLIGMVVEKVEGNDIICRVNNAGVVSNNKGVNIPNVHLSMPFSSEKDRADIIFAAKEGFDFIEIRDAEGALVGRYTGTELSDETRYIEGTGFSITLVSDEENTAWGFELAAFMPVYREGWVDDGASVYYIVNGERRSHTIDPRSGYPVQHSLLSATVTASTCMRADALATACMVLGEQAALEMINQTADAACYLIIADSDTLRIATSQRWYFE